MMKAELLPAMQSLAARFSRRAAPRALAPVTIAARQREGEPAGVPPLRPRVEIAVRDPDPGAATATLHRDQGRRLARQEAWEDLCKAIETADRSRALTPGLEPVSLLLAEGASSDVLRAAHGAIARDEPRGAHAAVASLEINLEDMPDCPSLSAIVALAHVEIAAVWRGGLRLRDLAPQRREAHDRHLQAAAAMADRFDPFEQDSPLWARIRCAVLDADPRPADRVADDYEDLIDLDPHCPDPMRALGRDLLPACHGSWEALDLQARRTAARTGDLWGAGAYAWVWMGALEAEPGAARRADPELFVQALHDILDRHPDQHMVNRLAAFTGITLSGGPGFGGGAARIAEAFGWIVGDHLTELHPGLWAAAAAPGRGGSVEAEPADLTARGRARALSTIAEYFAAQMGSGGRIAFGETGMRVV